MIKGYFKFSYGMHGSSYESVNLGGDFAIESSVLGQTISYRDGDREWFAEFPLGDTIADGIAELIRIRQGLKPRVKGGLRKT